MTWIIVSIIIAGLVILILMAGSLLHQQAERIRDLKEKLFHTDEALTHALEQDRREPLDTSNVTVIKQYKQKPWEDRDSIT